jgi:hypothetical protein
MGLPSIIAANPQASALLTVKGYCDFSYVVLAKNTPCGIRGLRSSDLQICTDLYWYSEGEGRYITIAKCSTYTDSAAYH